MRAVKLSGQVTKDRTLHLLLPKGIHEGPAEVIVLLPEGSDASSRYTKGASLKDFFDRPRVDQQSIRSKEEIDRLLRAERDSWE